MGNRRIRYLTSNNMKKISTLLFTLIFSLSIYAFHYRPELDGDGGLFFVTGDDAVSGILMLIGCGIVAFVCYKIAETISKKDKSKGEDNSISTILNIIGCIASIAAIALAFTLWWITLILFIIAIIGSVIYQKIEDKKERNKNTSNQEIEKKEIKVPQIEQNMKNLSDETDAFIEDIAAEEVIFIKDWSLLSFAKTFGPKMQVGSFTEEIYNIIYRACVFTKSNGTKTYVYFFHELGELSPQEIKDRKNELYIGKVPNGDYFLYSKSNKGWKLDKSGDAEMEYKSSIKPNITSLSDFIKTHGKLSIGSFVNDTTGELGALYAFTDAQRNRIFAVVSPLIGKISEEEIEQNKEDFYIYWEKEGCYFLCTELTEQMLIDRDKDPAYFMAEHDLEGTLILLNVERDFTNYTLTFENEMEKDGVEKINKNTDENEIQKTLDSLNLYNDEYNYEIYLLSVEQKIALFALLTFLGTSTFQKGKEDEVADILRDFTSTIKLYQENINKDTFSQIVSNKNRCIEIAKTIHLDGPFIEFVYSCGYLKDCSENETSFSYEYNALLSDIGFPKEDIEQINHGKYRYRFQK